MIVFWVNNKQHGYVVSHKDGLISTHDVIMYLEVTFLPFQLLTCKCS